MKSVSILFTVLLVLGCTNTINAQKQYQSNNTINPKIIEAVIQVESGGNPKAINCKSGALGLMQIMPKTGRSLGFTKEQLLNPKTNREAGTKYLSKLMSEYCSNNIHCALRSYYCGPGNRNKKACYRYADKVLREAKSSTSIKYKKQHKKKRTSRQLKQIEKFKPWTGYKFD